MYEFILEEPSAVYVDKIIKTPYDYTQVERPPYYPCYKELSSEQKWIYLKTLENLYTPDNDIGYVFLFYYGLERHLIEGNFEDAFNVIMKLRETYNNKSFQDYSFKALLSICLAKKREDLFDKFAKQINNNLYNIDVNFFLIYKQLTNSPLNAKEIVCFSRQFGFKNNLYIKKFPELFEKTLSGLITQKKISLYIDDLINAETLNKSIVNIFANSSIKTTTSAPNIIGSEALKNTIKSLLEETHNIVKLNKPTQTTKD